MLLDLDTLDATRRAWIAQLLDDKMSALLGVVGDGQVEVRLFASKGRVRKDPIVLLNSGPSAMV